MYGVYLLRLLGITKKARAKLSHNSSTYKSGIVDAVKCNLVWSLIILLRFLAILCFSSRKVFIKYTTVSSDAYYENGLIWVTSIAPTMPREQTVTQLNQIPTIIITIRIIGKINVSGSTRHSFGHTQHIYIWHVYDIAMHKNSLRAIQEIYMKGASAIYKTWATDYTKPRASGNRPSGVKGRVTLTFLAM